MSDAWHQYEQGWSWGRRIPRLEALVYVAAAVGLGISGWEFTLIGLALLFSGFPDALLGSVALAPAVLGAAVFIALARKVRAAQL